MVQHSSQRCSAAAMPGLVPVLSGSGTSQIAPLLSGSPRAPCRATPPVRAPHPASSTFCCISLVRHCDGPSMQSLPPAAQATPFAHLPCSRPCTAHVHAGCVRRPPPTRSSCPPWCPRPPSRLPPGGLLAQVGWTAHAIPRRRLCQSKQEMRGCTPACCATGAPLVHLHQTTTPPPHAHHQVHQRGRSMHGACRGWYILGPCSPAHHAAQHRHARTHPGSFVGGHLLSRCCQRPRTVCWYLRPSSLGCLGFSGLMPLSILLRVTPPIPACVAG